MAYPSVIYNNEKAEKAFREMKKVEGTAGAPCEARSLRPCDVRILVSVRSL